MKIPGLPIIKYDECLTSWLVRISEITDQESILQYTASLRHPDFDVADKKLLGYLSKLGVNEEIARNCFGARTTWLLPMENCSAYCFLCFQDDVSAGGAPYWRKSWCYLHCPMCIKHRKLLMVADPLSISLQKSWIVFMEECNGKYNISTRCELPWKQSNAPMKVRMLALKVQQFLIVAHKSNFVRLPGVGIVVSSAEVLAVARLLLESFLFPRLRPNRGDGVARTVQMSFPRKGGGMSIEQARQEGCRDCHVYSRVTALILVGCVFNLFPLARFRDAQKHLALTAVVCSGLAYDIGLHGMRFSSWKEHRLTINFLEELSEGLKYCLADFISGLKNIGRL